MQDTHIFLFSSAIPAVAVLLRMSAMLSAFISFCSSCVRVRSDFVPEGPFPVGDPLPLPGEDEPPRLGDLPPPPLVAPARSVFFVW